MHWKHSRFDVAYLILGNCHTYDEAYRVLCELEEDRQIAIDTSLAESIRAEGKVVGSKETLADDKEFEVNKLRAKSFIAETTARTKMAQPCLDEARREVDFIQSLKKLIKPLRQYDSYENHIAFQLCQPLEWKYDIFWQMYSEMCTNAGQISSELFMMAKMHPESEALIKGLDALTGYAQADFTSFMKMDKSEVFKLVSDSYQLNYVLNTKTISPNLLTFDDKLSIEGNVNAIQASS